MEINVETKQTTSFGTNKIHKLIGLKPLEFNPYIREAIVKVMTNNYSTAEVIDMSLNSNIQTHGYNTEFEWCFEIVGSPVQAKSNWKIQVRSTDILNSLLFKKYISPRVSWHNEIQEVLVVKSMHDYLLYLINKGKFEQCGKLKSYFTGIRIAKIEHNLKQLRPGEGVVCNYYPLTETLEPTSAVSVLTNDQHIPANVVQDVVRLSAVY